MPKIKDVKLTYYSGKVAPDESNNHLKRVFDEVLKRYRGEISVNKSSVIGQPKIKLEYKEICTENGWLGEHEFDSQEEVDFGLKTMPEDVIMTIQAETGLEPVEQEEKEEPDTDQTPVRPNHGEPVTDEDEEDEDISEKIRELSERAGLNDTPEPDFDN